jgi:ribosome-associated protein
MKLMLKNNDEKILNFVKDTLESIKAENVTILPVSELTTITNYMVIVTGTSTIHVRSIADKLIEQAKLQKINLLSVEGQEHANWVLVDFGDVIVHVMQESVRGYYDLEKLWSVI